MRSLDGENRAEPMAFKEPGRDGTFRRGTILSHTTREHILTASQQSDMVGYVDMCDRSGCAESECQTCYERWRKKPINSTSPNPNWHSQ